MYGAILKRKKTLQMNVNQKHGDLIYFHFCFLTKCFEPYSC